MAFPYGPQCHGQNIYIYMIDVFTRSSTSTRAYPISYPIMAFPYGPQCHGQKYLNLNDRCVPKVIHINQGLLNILSYHGISLWSSMPWPKISKVQQQKNSGTSVFHIWRDSLNCATLFTLAGDLADS